MSRLPDPARMCPVKAAPVDDLTDDWPICYQTGNSGAELWGIATDNVRGSVMASQDFPADAREDAEAIAAILNAYREGRLVPAPMPLFPERNETAFRREPERVIRRGIRREWPGIYCHPAHTKEG